MSKNQPKRIDLGSAPLRTTIYNNTAAQPTSQQQGTYLASSTPAQPNPISMQPTRTDFRSRPSSVSFSGGSSSSGAAAGMAAAAAVSALGPVALGAIAVGVGAYAAYKFVESRNGKENS
ncbi:hypothetical protein NIES2119_31840 [[Phormidium ambiguum] IAM M-71]|uniref:Uncharacterized protein n=1 Tax=[Phormidium ambiguum] IAM M-71 TaxID=454136 RepID=A0A1U7I1J1_9CYAN|nr:DUF1206 domain-containing protein [Phormidium ambiguum]OKH29879.1 hypothetical protein NIES2119_31840 [Phormidium ambiguum IAM M-71]